MKNLTEIPVSKYDISKEYDIYYGGGNNSIYNKRFGKDKFITNEKYIINQSINKVIKKLNNDVADDKHTIKILDFGCGDGRLFEVLESIALKNIKRKIAFEITAFDISLVGIKEYIQKLKMKNYKISYKQEDKPSIYYSMYNENIKIDFANANHDDQLEELDIFKDKKFHINLCMFSVLSHVISKDKRVEILRSFNNIAEKSAISIISVPGKKMFIKEYKAFNLLRNIINKSKDSNTKNEALLHLEKFLKPIENKGDIFYFRKSEDRFLLNFCHIFNLKSFRKELQEAGLNQTSLGILSIIYPPILTNKNLFVRITDFILSRLIKVSIFPSFVINNISDQIYCINEH